jgi:hypothetical protein
MMRINLRYSVAVGIAAAALTTLGPATAQASEIPGTTVMSAAESHYPGIGLGKDKFGLPAHQGAALRSNHRCDWDDQWCRDYDDYDHYHHGDYDDYGHHHHGDYDDYGHYHHGDYDRFR